MEIKFTKDNLDKLEKIKTRYPDPKAAIMPALWIAQEQWGWISTDIMKYVGGLLGIPYDHVYGVVSFYTMYNRQPVGKYHIQVCTNISCLLRGGYELLDYISKKLNLKPGETSPDKKFTISEVECLGSCGTAPAMQVNNYYEENLTKEKIDLLIEKYSQEN